MQVGGALLIVVGGSRGCGLRISATQEMILEQHPIWTARKCAITLVAAGFLISPLAACNAQEQAAQTQENGFGGIKFGMSHAEIVSIAGLGEAGDVPHDYPIHCDSWKYIDGERTKFIHVDFSFPGSDNVATSVTDDHDNSCFKQSVRQGNPADKVKVGMTYAEVVAAIGSADFTNGILKGDASIDSFAYIQDGKVRYLIVGYRYDSSISSAEPLVVLSVSDDNYGPYSIE